MSSDTKSQDLLEAAKVYAETLHTLHKLKSGGSAMAKNYEKLKSKLAKPKISKEITPSIRGGYDALRDHEFSNCFDVIDNTRLFIFEIRNNPPSHIRENKYTSWEDLLVNAIRTLETKKVWIFKRFYAKALHYSSADLYEIDDFFYVSKDHKKGHMNHVVYSHKLNEAIKKYDFYNKIFSSLDIMRMKQSSEAINLCQSISLILSLCKVGAEILKNISHAKSKREIKKINDDIFTSFEVFINIVCEFKQYLFDEKTEMGKKFLLMKAIAKDFDQKTIKELRADILDEN